MMCLSGFPMGAITICLLKRSALQGETVFQTFCLKSFNGFYWKFFAEMFEYFVIIRFEFPETLLSDKK